MNKEQVRDYIYNGIGDEKEVLQTILESACKIAKKYKYIAKNENNTNLYWYIVFMDSIEESSGICEQEHDEFYFESGDKTPEQKQRMREIGDFLSPKKVGLL